MTIGEGINVRISDTASLEPKYLSVYFDTPAENGTKPFYTFHHKGGGSVTTMVSSLLKSEHCNIGYSNADTGEFLGYVLRIPEGEKYTLYTYEMKEFNCSVHASTHSTPGWGFLTIAETISVSVR